MHVVVTYWRKIDWNSLHWKICISLRFGNVFFTMNRLNARRVVYMLIELITILEFSVYRHGTLGKIEKKFTCKIVPFRSRFKGRVLKQGIGVFPGKCHVDGTKLVKLDNESCQYMLISMLSSRYIIHMPNICKNIHLKF